MPLWTEARAAWDWNRPSCLWRGSTLSCCVRCSESWMLRPFLPDLQLHEAITLTSFGRADRCLPGMKYKRTMHQRAQITILDADSCEFVEYVNHHREEGLFALCFEEDLAGPQVPAISLGADDEDQARRLFAALRELDRRGAKKVYARCPGQGWGGVGSL